MERVGGAPEQQDGPGMGQAAESVAPLGRARLEARGLGRRLQRPVEPHDVRSRRHFVLRRREHEIEVLRSRWPIHLHEPHAATGLLPDPSDDRDLAPSGGDHHLGPGRLERRRASEVDGREARPEHQPPGRGAVVEDDLLLFEGHAERVRQAERLLVVAGATAGEDPDSRGHGARLARFGDGGRGWPSISGGARTPRQAYPPGVYQIGDE